MPVQTHYEVHVLQGSRWSIHAQFEGGQKEMAVDEGKMLDRQPGIDAVKVIREVYDPELSTHRDYVIYKSADIPAAGRTAEDESEAIRNSAQKSDDDWYEEDNDGGGDEYGGSFGGDQWTDSKPRKKKKDGKKTTLVGLIVKLLVVSLISITLAAIFTIITYNVLHGTMIFGYRMEGNFESNVHFVVFVTTFLLCATCIAVTQLKGTTLAEREAKARANQQRKAAVAQVKAAARSVKKQAAVDEGKTQRNALDQAMQGIDEFHIDEKQKTADENETDERLKSAIKGDDEGVSKANGGLDPDPQAIVETLSPHAEKQKKYMMEFLTNTLEGANTDQKKLDNFNKFGVNLFLASACETLAQSRDLDEKSRAKVLADSVRVMGFKKSHAATFAGKYEDYLMQDPRYMQMFQAGRNAMNTYYQDEDAASRHMQSALTEWNKPKQKAQQAGPVTVLFTDIAGSTAMTQALGDAGAQKVVRAHNRVVRDALTDCNGKEIKHTGDGIMASFSRITDSVDAAIQMQRQCMIHNQQNPDLPLHLKIGLNAGEPIAEDNDLFGTVVQMSARIVDKAQADEIFVSDIVRGICVGKPYKFINRGGYAMKGFDEDPTLYEVVWRDEAAAAE
ncbi:MAG: adenylate/guanylate cyclase domain-containing protein [Rhodospirillales bacterium]|nr:adenylate/guanylate cyclase domain-containing protein [Rhodospirillales bacterium]